MSSSDSEDSSFHPDVSFRNLSLVAAKAGYASHLPVLGQGYKHAMACKGRYHGRFVEFLWDDAENQPRVCEVWSPNSQLCPVVPGKRDPTFDPLHASINTLRVDGHTGIFDPLENPQNFSSRFPWWGFLELGPQEGESPCVWVDLLGHIRVRGKELEATMRIESSLIDALMDENAAVFLRITDFGTVGAEDSPLWLNKPAFPQTPDISQLAEYAPYNILLYRFTQVQRGIRLKKVWCRYVETECVARRGSSTFNVPGTFPPADDSLMGVFSEGMAAADLLWFSIIGRVPVFFVSRLSDSEVQLLPDNQQRYRPSELTIAGYRHSPGCPYEEAFKRHGGHLVERVVQTGVSAEISFVQLYGRDRNSSRERAYFELRGYLEDEESVNAYAQVCGEAVWDNYFLRRLERFFPVAHNILEIGALHIPCVIPPSPPRAVGTYDFFWMIRDISRPDEDYPYCFIKGKPLDPRWIGSPRAEAYYDWENRRVIRTSYAGDFTLPSGYLADARIYGFPAPPWRFYEYDAGGLHQLLCSYWWYAKPNPNPDGISPYIPPRVGGTHEYGTQAWLTETAWVDDLDEAERILAQEMLNEPVVTGPFTELPLPVPSSSALPDSATLKKPVTRAKSRRTRKSKQAEMALGLLHELEGVTARVGGFLQEIADQGSSSSTLRGDSRTSGLESRLSDEPYSHERAL
ncbi:hypothetical protein BDZ89DRAFT_1047718 [Hymenopellis radicata]|nr:hypothetical protein BDZ89DRAFT_1047718 [Hymenopellis radicata]